MWFAKKIADFVICRQDMGVMSIVELDDRTHDPPRERNRDAVTHAIGYATIRYHSRSQPFLAEIADTVGRLSAVV